MKEQRESESHRLVAGELCLDFVNTVNGHTRLPRHEYLHDYRDLVLWGRHADALTPGEASLLLRESARRPAEVEAVYHQGLDLRETLFRIFTALSCGGQADGRDLDRLNADWLEAQSHTCLVHSVAGFSLGWNDEPCLERLLRAVVGSAIQLLISPMIHQVRSCAGERCDWLFVDASRNHLRRWCSMDECGNRAKMQRRLLKQKLT
jgi:predicted RNA-binding Zn ribbon-like protein